MRAVLLLGLALAMGLLSCKEDAGAGPGATDGGTQDIAADGAHGDALWDLSGDAPTDLASDGSSDLTLDATVDLPLDLPADLDAAETTYPVLCAEYVKAMKQCGLPVPPDSMDFCAIATQAFWRCYAESADCQAAADCQILLEANPG